MVPIKACTKQLLLAYLYSRDNCSYFRLVYHMHVHTLTHTTTILVGCLALRISTADSYRCPLVAALSPREKLGQNYMREKVCCVFLPIKTNTHIQHTQRHTTKGFFYLTLPWLFIPSCISPYWNTLHPVFQSLCFLCLCVCLLLYTYNPRSK